YGDDLNILKSIGEDLSAILKPIRGSGNVRVQRVLGLPLLEIKANREKMSRYEVSSEEILNVVETLRIGVSTGKVFEGLRSYDLILRMNVDVSDLKEVENLPVMTSFGNIVPLGLVADIELNEGPAAIYRETLKRRLFVEVNIRGRDLVSYINEAKEKTKSYLETKIPEGYEVKWGGQFENFTRAKNRLGMVVPVALVIIFSMLIAAFGNINYALGVFLVIPLAISGGIISLIIRGLPFSIPAGVGFIAVSGISVLNGVVYASVLKEKLSLGMPLEEAVIKSALQSLRPILTTQIIAGIGFLPMAISSNAGAEVQRPLATVVIGGIIVVTLLSNLFLPIILEFLLQKGFTFEQKSSIQIASEPKENIAVVEKERKKKKMESSEVKKEPGEENKA
ncbi:MAG: efflux RND transporter permease subunit, partial [Leptospiraceae bacterium]|nr:efflux RND transporter permease subunit [Leptospiraceae bacterium]